jgi:uncharacterized membrane protein YccC
MSFPTPFLIIFYVSNAVPDDPFERFFTAVFLMLAGGIVGMVFYYRDTSLEGVKDWFPKRD